MVKTAVGYPEEPSRKALVVAKIAVGVGGAVAFRQLVKKSKGHPEVRAVLALAPVAFNPLAIRALALWLTRMGIV